MSMRTEILSALEQSDEPMTGKEIVDQVHRQSGTEWKRSSVLAALGRLVTVGKVKNLDRDPATGYYRRIPCRYELAS